MTGVQYTLGDRTSDREHPLGAAPQRWLRPGPHRLRRRLPDLDCARARSAPRSRRAAPRGSHLGAHPVPANGDVRTGHRLGQRPRQRRRDRAGREPELRLLPQPARERAVPHPQPDPGRDGTGLRRRGRADLVTDAALPPAGDTRNYTVIQTVAGPGRSSRARSSRAGYPATAGDYFHRRRPVGHRRHNDAPNGRPATLQRPDHPVVHRVPHALLLELDDGTNPPATPSTSTSTTRRATALHHVPRVARLQRGDGRRPGLTGDFPYSGYAIRRRIAVEPTPQDRPARHLPGLPRSDGDVPAQLVWPALCRSRSSLS